MLHRLSILFLAALTGVAAMAAPSGQSRRLKDEDVKKLMEESKKDVERFTDAVDSRHRKSTFRSPTGDAALESYLKDLKKRSELMRDKFKEDYPAGREVLSFLRQASALETRAAEGGALFGAEKEWPRLRGTLSRLSRVYGIDWSSSPESWAAARMNDRELQRAIESYAASSKVFKKSLGSALEHMNGIGSTERKAVLSAVDRLESLANDVKGAVGDGKDASAKLGLIQGATDEIQSFLETHGLTNAVGSSFRTLGKELSTITTAMN